MKLQHCILLLVFLVAKSEANCTRNGVACPDYQVLETLDGYEKRLYPEATLVSTTGKATNRRRVLRRLILRLYRYIGGFNEEGTPIELMVPVRTLKSPGENYNNYTISFFLPKESSENPPKPRHPRVVLQKEPAAVYAARSFGNFVTDESIWDNEAETIFNLLPEGEVQSKEYFWAVYDPPVRRTNRLNEVWVRLGTRDENEIF